MRYEKKEIDLLDEALVEEIKRIIEKHYSKIMTEFDENINTDCLDLEIKVRYDDFYSGFELYLK